MPALIVKPRARIYHGHDWVYGSEIQRVTGNPQPGDVVELVNLKSRMLGSAIYNPKSQIVARRFSRRKQDLDADFFFRRIGRAQELRESMNFPEPVYRLAWSEADGLPGLIVDRYGSHLVVQTLTLALDQRKDLIAGALTRLLEPESIIERNDSPIRKAEGLELTTGVLHGRAPAPFEIEINGIRQRIDLLQGQKTGIYLDQVDNYASAGHWAPNRRVLDCFCNQGGFALHCARAGAASVTAIDSSDSAIAAAKENAQANDLSIEWLEANAFDFLKKSEAEFSRSGRNEGGYDLIILDPPSFTRNRKSLNDALRGYKEIHLRALKLLTKDGLLATFCCSHHVKREEFLQVICDASVDAKRTVRVIDRFTQRRDHPVIPTIPETEYLKGFLFQAVPGW